MHVALCVCAFQSSGINTSLAAWACMGGEGSIEEVFQHPAPLQTAADSGNHLSHGASEGK